MEGLAKVDAYTAADADKVLSDVEHVSSSSQWELNKTKSFALVTAKNQARSYGLADAYRAAFALTDEGVSGGGMHSFQWSVRKFNAKRPLYVGVCTRALKTSEQASAGDFVSMGMWNPATSSLVSGGDATMLLTAVFDQAAGTVTVYDELNPSAAVVTAKVAGASNADTVFYPCIYFPSSASQPVAVATMRLSLTYVKTSHAVRFTRRPGKAAFVSVRFNAVAQTKMHDVKQAFWPVLEGATGSTNLASPPGRVVRARYIHVRMQGTYSVAAPPRAFQLQISLSLFGVRDMIGALLPATSGHVRYASPAAAAAMREPLDSVKRAFVDAQLAAVRHALVGTRRRLLDARAAVATAVDRLAGAAEEADLGWVRGVQDWEELQALVESAPSKVQTAAIELSAALTELRCEVRNTTHNSSRLARVATTLTI